MAALNLMKNKIQTIQESVCNFLPFKRAGIKKLYYETLNRLIPFI